MSPLPACHMSKMAMDTLQQQFPCKGDCWHEALAAFFSLPGWKKKCPEVPWAQPARGTKKSCTSTDPMMLTVAFLNGQKRLVLFYHHHKKWLDRTL